MNKTDFLLFWKHHLRTTVPRVLFFYILLPFMVLMSLAEPIRGAVLRSDTAAFWILPAAALAVGLNWYIYSAVRKKRPSLLVYAYGALCLLIVTAVTHGAYPSDHRMTSTLAVIGGFLLIGCLFLFSYWLASRPGRTKFAHGAAVVIWVILFLILAAMVYDAARDIETGLVSVDTWITFAGILLFILAACAPWILSSRRKAAARNRKAGLTEGRIVQIIGETRLDRDDDLVTRNHCRVQYTVDHVSYEARAPISRFTTRRFGRKNFIGLKVPVYYDPENPADTYIKKIDKHIFDQLVTGPDAGSGSAG